jgi:hypothetical protein
MKLTLIYLSKPHAAAALRAWCLLEPQAARLLAGGLAL